MHSLEPNTPSAPRVCVPISLVCKPFDTSSRIHGSHVASPGFFPGSLIPLVGLQVPPCPWPNPSTGIPGRGLAPGPRPLESPFLGPRSHALGTTVLRNTRASLITASKWCTRRVGMTRTVSSGIMAAEGRRLAFPNRARCMSVRLSPTCGCFLGGCEIFLRQLSKRPCSLWCGVSGTDTGHQKFAVCNGEMPGLAPNHPLCFASFEHSALFHCSQTFLPVRYSAAQTASGSLPRVPQFTDPDAVQVRGPRGRQS